LPCDGYALFADTAAEVALELARFYFPGGAA